MHHRTRKLRTIRTRTIARGGVRGRGQGRGSKITNAVSTRASRGNAPGVHALNARHYSFESIMGRLRRIQDDVRQAANAADIQGIITDFVGEIPRIEMRHALLAVTTAFVIHIATNTHDILDNKASQDAFCASKGFGSANTATHLCKSRTDNDRPALYPIFMDKLHSDLYPVRGTYDTQIGPPVAPPVARFSQVAEKFNRANELSRRPLALRSAPKAPQRLDPVGENDSDSPKFIYSNPKAERDRLSCAVSGKKPIQKLIGPARPQFWQGWPDRNAVFENEPDTPKGGSGA